MTRDAKNLRVLHEADELVIAIYRATRSLPAEERFGLQSQLRRAAVSVASNLVEGAARRSLRDYTRFIELSLSSASEVRYLISILVRLYPESSGDIGDLASRYTILIRSLQKMIVSLEALS